MRKHLILASALFGVVPAASFAADAGTVTVVDCQAMPRAASPAAEVKGVELKFEGSLQQATLTETSSKEKLEVALSKGTALFEGVKSGTWSACQPGEIQAVAISLKTGDNSTVVGALSAAGLAGGALAIAGSGGSSDGVDGAASVPSVNRETVASIDDEMAAPRVEEVAFGGTPGKNQGDCTVSMATVGGCRNEESPAPLSPFS